MRFRPTLLGLAVATLALLASPATAQEVGKAGVVVDFGNGEVKHACVEFDGPEINGLQLLEMAGFDVDTQSQSLGETVCAINGTGCDYPNQACFCSCSGSGECVFWIYWILEGGDWKKSSVGAGTQPVGNGDVNGWSWSSKSPPPVRTFDEICGDSVSPKAADQGGGDSGESDSGESDSGK
ncbi:MAG: hypothetical protein AAGD01_11010 [Acidobacteriota bacterium]